MNSFNANTPISLLQKNCEIIHQNVIKQNFNIFFLYFLYLFPTNQTEARAEIIGQPVKYLTPGSVLKLNCRVIQSTEMAAYIFWYHNNRMINYDVDRGINVSIEANFHNSELTILNTQEKHSGNYTCVPSNSQPASVLVHIFKGMYIYVYIYIYYFN